ncbi:hypothetical protein DB30_03154 [Enhygromyxa salina]|uniref:Uncharacterized protein n=1 Tax=Enhygromyxa salina TaxID=215803 RepID=A0A0C2A221_9BACT|nr:hypothetical protein [Enhygromyxa salina]KIG17453.1 hypothetical protein DB30_03154 [Enhygromyxa salina]
MASASLYFAVTLLLGPPVQKPAVGPAEPATGEAAIAPAHVDSEAASSPEPDLSTDPEVGPIADPPADADPDPVPEPLPDSGANELPSWQSEPVPLPTGDPNDVQVVDEWGVPVVVPVDRGPAKGGGFYAAAGGLFGIMITRQWVTALTCSDVYCGNRGFVDRALSLGTMGFAAGGGWFDGRRAAWKEDRDGTGQKKLTGRRAAGWTLFALGVSGLIADTVLYNVCYDKALGPYTQLDGFSYTCSPVASVVVLDFSTLFGAVGMGLGMSAESQLKHRKKYELSVAPWGGHGQAGLSLSGRF